LSHRRTKPRSFRPSDSTPVSVASRAFRNESASSDDSTITVCSIGFVGVIAADLP